jgi:hypothetical protein
MMRMAGDIPITRGSRDSAVQAIAAGRDRLVKRVSVMIFPEGTRSDAVDMRPFKDGAFRLAIEQGVPILPIAVAGTRHAMAKHSFQFRPAVATAACSRRWTPRASPSPTCRRCASGCARSSTTRATPCAATWACRRSPTRWPPTATRPRRDRGRAR